MSRFKKGDLVVVTRGWTEYTTGTLILDDDDPDRYHCYIVGAVLQITDVTLDEDMNMGYRPKWGSQYVAEPAYEDDHNSAWADRRDEGSQYVHDIHLGPPLDFDLSPTSVEKYLNGATELVGGLIKTSQTPSNTR